MTAVLRDATGTAVTRLHVERYCGQISREERQVLRLLSGPVLDIGCGPGRHVRALEQRGIATLGIDVSPSAVRLARQRGAMTIRRSIFESIPLEGRWNGALLLDGNIGIGGDPVALLRRVRTIVSHKALVIVETDRPGSPSGRAAVSLYGASPFAWATVAADDIEAIASAADFSVLQMLKGGGRWFARLGPRS